MNKKLTLIFTIALLNSQLATASLVELTKEFKDDTFTKDALSSWTLSGDFQAAGVSTCGGKTIAGGYKVAGNGSISKKFTSSQEIKNVVFDFELYLIDYWNNGWKQDYANNNQFQVFINDSPVMTLGNYYQNSVSDICGLENYNDKKTRVALSVPVNAKEFTIKLAGIYQKAQNSASQSWGIRDLSIYSDDGQGYQIVANELNDDNFDGSKWATTFKSQATICNKKILGGYNIAGNGHGMGIGLEKLPAHQFITFSFSAYFIDSWDTNDSMFVLLDQKTIHEQAKFGNQASQCGNEIYGEFFQKIVITVPHTGDSAFFFAKLNLDQNADDESFGIRDFQAYVSSPCTVIYSESNGKGKSLQVCGNIPNLKNVGWTQPIKGIFVPYGLQVTVYRDADFSGKKYVISKTDLNLSGDNYVLVNQAFNIDVSENKLRRNS